MPGDHKEIAEVGQVGTVDWHARSSSSAISLRNYPAHVSQQVLRTPDSELAEQFISRHSIATLNACYLREKREPAVVAKVRRSSNSPIDG
jgi:hypothetical protein